MVSYASERDGPQFDRKQCQTCSSFMPSGATVCPSCRIPATQLGSAAVNASIDLGWLDGGNSTLSNHQATTALANTFMELDPDREYVFAEIQSKRGAGNKAEWLVEWAGLPSKKVIKILDVVTNVSHD